MITNKSSQLQETTEIISDNVICAKVILSNTRTLGLTTRAYAPVATASPVRMGVHRDWYQPDFNISPVSIFDPSLLISLSYTCLMYFLESSVTVPLPFVLRMLLFNLPHKTTECDIIVPAIMSF